MKAKIFIILFLCLASFGMNALLAQNINERKKAQEYLKKKKEVYFTFNVTFFKEVNDLSQKISIDKVSDNKVFAYANAKEFETFLTYGYDFTVLKHPGDLDYEPKMLTKEDLMKGKSFRGWTSYPTYDAYETIMYQFATDYPSLCEIVNIGTLPSGRKLLAAKISDNVSTPEAEPQFLYTGTIHGDETAGYILLLNLIDSLLEGYSTSSRIANMVDNMEIWINPLSNPDGTYAGGNSSVNGATRYNSNSVDLNRNYADPEDGPHPDGNAWQPETVFFMTLAANNNFIMSANTHGGAEVINYPWDTWSRFHADDDWWQLVSNEYADTAQHYSPAGYLDDFGTGITNGYAWYTISGGRQDYMNYFHQCREVTMELSNTKLLPESQLLNWWHYNRRSLLNYMEQALYGFSGIVSDSLTGEPLVARVEIPGHELDSSHIYSRNGFGNYHRLINAGTYTLEFSAPGYYPKSLSNVTIGNYQAVVNDVQLVQGLFANFNASRLIIPENTSISFFDQSYGHPNNWTWNFEGGTPASSGLQNPVNIEYASSGEYNVSLEVQDSAGGTNLLQKDNYIKVLPNSSGQNFTMSNDFIAACSGNFYDPGGLAGQYANNQDFTMTFIPSTVGDMLEVDFTSFDLEFQSNCNYDYLEIYDGSDANAFLIGKYCGTSGPGVVTATNPEGALTFVFHSDVSSTGDGWEASLNCVPPQIPPVAQFTANPLSVHQTDTVYFTDLSANYPDTWLWEFEGTTEPTSSLQNPFMVYSDTGFHDVKLVVENTYGSDTIVKENYIYVEGLVNVNIHKQDVFRVKIFPNPATSDVHLESTLPIESIWISDELGKIQLLEEGEGNKSLIIDVLDMQSGFYIVHVLTQKGIYHGRFIKQ